MTDKLGILLAQEVRHPVSNRVRRQYQELDKLTHYSPPAITNLDGHTDGTMEHSNTGPTMTVPIVHQHQLSGLEWLFKHKELVGTAIVVVPLVAWLLWLLWYLGMAWKALITFIWTR